VHSFFFFVMPILSLYYQSRVWAAVEEEELLTVNPTTIHPPIINIPPRGVVGPMMAFGPIPKERQYIDPENMTVPIARRFPAQGDNELLLSS
jgi:hypothetical protein